MGWIIALGVLGLLAVLPLGASVKYDAGGPLVKVIAGPVRITLFPRNGKKPKGKKSKQEKTEVKEEKKVKSKPAAQKPKKKAKTPSGTSEKKAEKTEAPKKGGSITDFLPLLKVALDFLDGFRRKLRVDRLDLQLTMAGGDPCDLGINYGRAWAAVGNLMPRLERVLVIKKRDIGVACDFTADKTIIYVRLDLTITLGRLLALAGVYGFQAIREYLKIKNKRKGGALK